MGLFDAVRDLVGEGAGDDRTPTPSDLPVGEGREPSPTAFRNSAVDAVQQWGDYDLDFSLDSLVRLDDLARKRGAALDVFADEQGEDAAADRHVAYTVQAGSYLGEVLVRRCDGRWEQNDDGMWLVRIPQGEDAIDVDVFEVASHSFAEAPAFGDVRERLGDDEGEGDPGTEDGGGTEERPVPTAEMETYAEELASVYEEYDLDFTPSSLARLDALADAEFDPERFADAELGGEDMDSGMYTELLKQLGSYVGEVFVREHDGEWVRHGDTIAVTVSGEEGKTAIAHVFEAAEESLTGPSQFASTYNAVTDEASVYAPEVADHAAAVPASDANEPVDIDGPTVEVTDPFDGNEAEPDDAEAATAGEETPETTSNSRSTEPAADAGGERAADANGAGPEAATAGGETADQSAAPDDAFDVAAVARDIVADDLDGDPTVEDTGDSGSSTPADEAGRDDRSGRSTVTPDDDESTAADETAEDLAVETLELTDESEGAEPGWSPAALRDDAAAFAATWPGYDLDFSPESLERLDALVAEEYPDIAHRDQAFTRARAAEIGGYLGEVCREALDAEWCGGDEPALAVGVDERRLEPLAVARARFRGETTLAEAYDRVHER